jgi:PAS domain S-box-containing protein
MPVSDAGFRSLEGMLGGPMEVGDFLRLAVAIASALGRVHQQGLVHKDIKPANILVNPHSGEVRFTGFDLSSRLARERPQPRPPESIVGTLAYMAPEQTGRMNRSIDSRSDLYALGVTLYQMLTGSLPFTATDPMEWVHCHIARKPVPPSERLENIPAPVSAIVMRLLVKTPENRYQTAGGVGHDLRRCLAAWEAERRIDDFPLGEHDVPDRLLVPEKLYGRAREIETLLTAFDRTVTGGKPELVLVSGYSGVGKSSVVNELHKVLVPPRGLFASGKFDQYKRDIPYATLAQAFQSLVRYLLGRNDAELSGWRDALAEALGPNGPLMIDLVPELKLIIGEQPPVPELPPQDARRRFQAVFRRFIGVFAQSDHPLALFLDDLQWLDAATLDLLEDLLTPPGVPHLMLIGAYRDNEVTAAHPLTRKLEAIRSAGAYVQEITLAPLAAEDVAQLIADALRCEPERAAPLARLVHEKTGGNPFFANRFIASLAEEGMLTFDHDAARWSWDLGRIEAKGYTDNLVDLMAGKLTRLSAETQKAVQQLACLGNAAAVATLSLVYGATETEIHSLLEEAVRADLLERRKDAYHFIHDRIQEAAYLLVPDSVRPEAHLRIGRLLAANTPPEQREEAIYEIVNQLNRGAPLITLDQEREQLAELNLIAGKRAKAATAYGSALNYLALGEALLPEDCGERRYPLVFAMEVARAECEFLTGDLAAAEERLAALSLRAANLVDKAAVACLRTALYTTLARADRAVEICIEYLREAGVACSPHPKDEEVSAEYERLWTQLGSQPIEALFDLPLMSDPDWRATMEVLTDFQSPAFQIDVNLSRLVVLRTVNLSVEHGNSDGSCNAYGAMNTIVGGRFGNHRAGFRFGLLSLDLLEKKGLDRFKARVYFAGGWVLPWGRHFRAGTALLRRSLETALETGDQTYAAYAHYSLVSFRLASADPLLEVQREAECALEFAQKTRNGPIADIVKGQLGFIRTVRGLTREFGSFGDDGFDEGRFEEHLEASPPFINCWYWIRKLQARFYAGDYPQAIAAAAKARPLLDATSGLFEEVDYHFYAALARAAASDSATPDERREHSGALAEHHQRLALWAEDCPENFANRAALVGAEIARIDGRVVDAEQLYEQAIRSAHEHGFVQNEGLAYELAARFYAARGFDEIAHLYLGNARQGYLRWGADGKVRQLDELYPRLGQHEPAPDSRATIAASVERLELATVLKVSQAVSGEIALDRLVETLLRTAIEQAGAERGLLILPHGGELLIQAEAKTCGSSVTVRLRETPISAHELPGSLVRYAARTQENVILDDALVRNPFSSDEYIREQRPRSVLCLPLVKQGALVALLYMENNLGPGFFSPDRIVVLKVLASQAAISLDNSRLYRELQEREGKIRRLVDANIVGILISDSNGEVIESNDAFLKMVGYTREELVSGRMRWRDMTPAKWKVASENGVTQVETTGVCKVFEKEYYRKDGSRVPVLVGAARFEKSSTVAFAVDLTELKRAEETLQRSQHYLAEAQKASHTGSWAWSPVSGALLYWSDECYRISGYDPAQGLPSFESSFERIHPEDRPAVAEAIERAVRDKAEFQFEYRQMLPDGPRRNVRILAHPVLDASGKLVEFIGTVMDVTEQKRAEEERREHLWFLESMDRINRAVQRTNDVEGMTSGVLEEAFAIFGCDRASLLYPCDPDSPTIRAVMEHTLPEFPGAFALGVEVMLDSAASELLRNVLLAPGTVENPAISYELRERFSVRSMIAIAIRPKGDRPYLFALTQCSRSRAWTAAERRIFEEIARRLEDALTSVLAHRNLLSSQEELRASEQRFRTFVDQASDAFFLYDDEGLVRDVNRRACESLGYSREELIGMRPSQFNVGLTPERIAWIRQRLREHGSVTANHIRRRKDGTLFPVEVRARGFDLGGHLFIMALATDITERRRREQCLLAQHAVTQELSEAASLEAARPRILRAIGEALKCDFGVHWGLDSQAGVLRCLATWSLETAQPAFEAAMQSASFGPGEELPGRAWSTGTPECVRDLAADPSSVRAGLAANARLHAAFAFPIAPKSGVACVIEFFSREVRDADPELLQAMTTVGSQIGQFVERTRAEDALRAARSELAHVTRVMSMGELTASIAHEVNQPLGAMVANAASASRWLAANPPNLEKASLALARIAADGERASAVIDRIRRLVRRQEPGREPIDVNETIRSLAALMRGELERAGIARAVRLADNLPPILGDRVLLQQVILNLILNAIDAMRGIQDRARSLRIESRLDEQHEVRVEVRDTGRGLPPDARLFEAFYTTKEGGLGMGLSISRSIVEAHGGRMHARPNVPHGAVFEFSLPVAQP